MRRLDDEITCLFNRISEMSRLAAWMMEDSVKALIDGDLKLAHEVIEAFDRVDRYDREIEEAAVRILTLFQPAASDLRTAVTVLKCITYLDRIAKYCKNLAIATEYLADKPRYPVFDLLVPMGEMAAGMVRMASDGLEKRSVDGFDRIVEMDDYLDEHHRVGLDKVVEYIKSNPESTEVCMYYFTMMRYLERVGDHSCKIAEKVTYMVSGERTRIF